MVEQGDDGIGGDYTCPLGAEVQGSSDLLKVDMYRELCFSLPEQLRLIILHCKTLEKSH